ncbi:MAG: glucosamine-6-phosphate deaminase [Puniceicoccaceae bacterium]|nr:MAG: glucosamine-6-phosphate deaminase [Puniceicoccaceae bacterium]
MKSEKEQFEKIPTRIYPSADQACAELAAEMADLIRRRAGENRRAVFGLATGSTPVRLYRELIRLHREEGLSFANVVTFNLDEYHPIEPDHSQSYHRFMREQLFDHIDIPDDHIHIPPGAIERTKVFQACAAYEEAIREAGGIDLQILGIGRTGHIGFNEPGSGRDSRTRLVTLDRLTRQDAEKDFLGEANVPRYAITMGVATILEARAVVLMAWGEGKAAIVRRAVEGEISEAVSASFLQEHRNARFLLDDSAAADLTQRKLPWRVGPCDWTPALSRRAVVWLSDRVGKPVLKLVDEEYNEHGMGELLTEEGPAYNINIRVFNQIQHTITGWPGGKPNADDSHRPERATPHPKRVAVLSPEPHDDVCFLGGTLNRLVRQGHEVHVVYLTSGNLAVADEEARKYAAFLADVEASTGDGGASGLGRIVLDQLAARRPGAPDTPEIRRIKSLIRREEARSACRICGVPEGQLRFLDLPFYENGRLRQFFAGPEDLDRVREVLEAIRPHQVYTAGDLSDPASSRRICADLVRRALDESPADGWVRDCYLWLYRGSDQEWATDEIDMAVPLSPDELSLKILAIYQHQSQKRQLPGREDRLREAWQQAEARNRALALAYDRLGLAEYEAIEAFRRGR